MSTTTSSRITVSIREIKKIFCIRPRTSGSFGVRGEGGHPGAVLGTLREDRKDLHRHATATQITAQTTWSVRNGS